jgi:choline dehydrogenase-like flavoprotein
MVPSDRADVRSAGYVMLIDARSLESGTTLEADVGVIGAGAAGITIARELAGRGLTVCVIESGGLEREAATQDLCAGEVVGLPYYPLDATRLRYLGGSTNHWAGGCRPLDPVDFEQRDWVPHSGWPFGREELDPFYARAHEICRLDDATYESDRWEASIGPRLPPGERIVPKLFRTRPTRFATQFRADLENAPNVRLYHHANVIEIVPVDGVRRVERLRVACLEGPVLEVRARAFVLATGGIENARLLLLSNTVRPRGLGNDRDLVGRFFMDHFGFDGGVFLPADPYVRFGLYRRFQARPDGAPMRAAWSPAPATLRQERILSLASWLMPVWPEPALKLRALRAEGPDSGFRHFVRQLGRVLADLDDTAPAAIRRWRRGRFPVEYFRLDYQCEQAPNPDSRVTLADARDPLGCPRARLDWRLTELDRRSVARATEIFGQELGRAGLGRIRFVLEDSGNGWPASLTGGHHHMGTTRMHQDPRQGVVDADGRVHGLSNLFVAGSSVFPTAGCAHPTLTIVALAVRLAHHLERELGA